MEDSFLHHHGHEHNDNCTSNADIIALLDALQISLCVWCEPFRGCSLEATTPIKSVCDSCMFIGSYSVFQKTAYTTGMFLKETCSTTITNATNVEEVTVSLKAQYPRAFTFIIPSNNCRCVSGAFDDFRSSACRSNHAWDGL